MTEKSLTNSIMQRLRYHGIFCIKIHGGAHQVPGLPDVWAVIEGRLVAMEVKLPKSEGGKDATKLQVRTLDRLRKAGAVAKVVRSIDDAMRACGVDGNA